MKFAFVVGLALASLALAACQPGLTLEEAQAQCTKQGGLLVVIYTEKITRSSIGPVVASPGNCVSPSKFEKETPPPAPSAPPAAAPNVSSAPAAAN